MKFCHFFFIYLPRKTIFVITKFLVNYDISLKPLKDENAIKIFIYIINFNLTFKILLTLCISSSESVKHTIIYKYVRERHIV